MLEWAVRQTGPAACALLGDMGAEIIKIESPDGGDPSRVTRKQEGMPIGLAHGMSYPFEVHNRNKRSIVLDLRTQEGKEVLFKLVRVCDVFVQNFRQGVAKRLGLDYDTLRRYNPSLVYSNCSGFGPKGPLAHQPVLDLVGQASSGLMVGVAEPGAPPMWVPGAITDQTTALMHAFAILVALHARERTGQGQEVHVSLLGTWIWVQTNLMLVTLLTGRPWSKSPRAKAPNPLWNWYRCQDGKWIALGHYQSDRYWPTLCQALGLAHLQHDPRFATQEAREKNCEELVAIFDEEFVSKTRDEWLQVLRQAGDLIYAPVQDYTEVIASEQVAANEYIREFEHPSLGRIKEIVAPISGSVAASNVRRPAPQWGEHTEEVLQELAGYTCEELGILKEQGVIP